MTTRSQLLVPGRLSRACAPAPFRTLVWWAQLACSPCPLTSFNYVKMHLMCYPGFVPLGCSALYSMLLSCRTYIWPLPGQALEGIERCLLYTPELSAGGCETSLPRPRNYLNGDVVAQGEGASGS